MSKTWWSSDIHVNHRSIMRYTPRGEVLGFGPQDENENIANAEVERRIAIHNDWMRDTINAVVQPQDRFYVLGDIFFGDKWHAAHWLSQINCRHKILVGGNHDDKMMEFYAANTSQELFEEVHLFGTEVKLNGRRIVMCHFPIVEWNAGHHGSWMLHGHCHGNFDYAKADLADKKILDVGWDNAIKVMGQYRPFEMADIEKYMEGRVNITHHNKAG